MNTRELLVSGVHITEDEYSYRGLFIMSNGSNTLEVDISDLDDSEKVSGIQEYFDLEDPVDMVRNQIMEMVMEKASISSRINEGENYNEGSTRKHVEKSASSLDRA